MFDTYPGNPLLNAGVSITSPRILGGNPGVFTGAAVFNGLAGGSNSGNLFSVGYGIGGYLNFSAGNAGIAVNSSFSLGLSIPFRGSL
ncbi:MAG: hypothetical protein HC764_10795 [Pleurocapsa sp. CRU_1_2]|nr:hypothetical protein [Pleurocapsa sp. CRU_1_2]